MSNLLPASAEATAVVGTPALELERLGRYLETHARGFRGLRSAERLVGGNSNPIWRLEADSGLYILRTQPAGQLLKSAHALDREVRVLSALYASCIPVPRLLLCNDMSVVGVQFYLMDFIDGVIHRDMGLPDVPTEQRRACYDAAIDALAKIHRCDVAAFGLSGFGRPGNYFERQLHRWTRQYETAMPEGNAQMNALISRLQRLVPQGPHAVVLLHGDARLDNLMFDRVGARIIAVLDWELSTLGHPLADLGQFLAVQELPWDYLLPGLRGVDRRAQGLPSPMELAARYLEAMRMDPKTDLRFFKAFAMFRQAAMSAGLRRRAALGTAVSEGALAFGNTMHVFAQIGLDILDAPDE
jgi:aminoglycoside phosphotransferase (APT) family kinase protein